jgi:single-stranded DNA-binding protein
VNRVELLGHVVSAVSLRKVADDKSKADFLVSVTRSETQQGRDIVRVVAWNSLADDAATKLTKGSRVKVEGRLNGYFYPRNAPKGTKVELRSEVVAIFLQEMGAPAEATAHVETVPEPNNPEPAPAQGKSKRTWLTSGESR